MKVNRFATLTGSFMKKQGRRWFAGAMAACMIAGMGATARPVLAAETESETAMGRYLEYEVALPEEGMNPHNLVVMENGRLRLFADTAEGKYEFWDSQDGGETWTLASELSELNDLSLLEDFSILTTALCVDGSGAVIAMEPVRGDEEEEEEILESGLEVNDSDKTEESQDVIESEMSDISQPEYETESVEVDEDSGVSYEYDTSISWDLDVYTYEYWLITFDESGITGKVLLDGVYWGDLFFSRDGSLFYHEYYNNVYRLDPVTGETVMEYPAEYFYAVTACGSELVILTDEGIVRYDIESGDRLEEDTALTETLSSDSNASSNPVFAEDADGRLFYATSAGIYTHQMDGSVVEQVVDGGLNSLSDPSCTLDDLAVSGKVFYTIYFNYDSGTGIHKYVYSADTPSVPENELTIWSLEEDEDIRQAISLYQSAHPDTYITYEVGITGDSGVTASDAIRTLNTEILAGNGPDILILDGLSVDTYTSQGLLLDLTDLMVEIQQSDGFLENIAYTYQDEDGVWAVPLQFTIPVIAGTTESMESFENFTDLAEFAEAGVYNVAGAAEILYDVCAGSWEKEDGTLDQEKLAEYVHVVKQLADRYAAAEEHASEYEDVEYYDDEDSDSSSTYAASYVISGLDTLEWNALEMLYGSYSITTAHLTNAQDYMAFTSVFQVLGGGSIETLTGQQEHVFIPGCTAGILSTSQNQEVAENFVSYLLSEEGQLTRSDSGWPVNAAAFDSLLYENDYETNSMVIALVSEDENSIELQYVWPTDEEIEWLRDTAYSLSVRAEDGAVQKEVVMEELERCLTEETSEEEAVNAIMQKINLYLAE
ncbi:MAG: extracellular solute-binding protein [Lachnospiraceae bacterium]|nr:extracellular solute-binding protein [Lachnospiraceae bacterium]